MHQHSQCRAVGIASPPEPYPVVLTDAIRIEAVLDAHIGLHVSPRFSRYHSIFVIIEQSLYQQRIGRTRAERWLRLHGVKPGPLVTGPHLISIMQPAPCGLGKSGIGASTGVVSAARRELVDGCNDGALPLPVDSSLSADDADNQQQQSAQRDDFFHFSQ